jgi:hypothetical protein
MTSLPAVSFSPSIIGTTGTAARRHGHGRGKAPALARPMTSLPASIVGTTGTAAGEALALARSMTALPAVSLPLELAGVDHRHHGRHDDQLAELPAVDRRHHGHGRGEAPALARSMTALPGLGTLARHRSSTPRAAR